MAEAQQDGVMRRKIAAAKAQLAEGGPGADRGWRLALARAARDRLSLPLEVTALAIQRHSLTELLELPPQQALIAVLQGPADGMGLLILSPPVLAAMIGRGAVDPGLYKSVLQSAETRDPRGYVIPADQADMPTVVTFLNALIKTGVDVDKATKPFKVAGKTYPAGSYVVKTAQAYRPRARHVRAAGPPA